MLFITVVILKPGTVAVDHTEFFCPTHVMLTIKAWVSCVFITVAEGTVSICDRVCKKGPLVGRYETEISAFKVNWSTGGF